MKRMIIHIGLHKTGTTFLQKEYFPNISNLTYYTGSSFFNSFSRIEVLENFLISEEGLSGLPWNSDWKRAISNRHSWFESYKKSILNLKKMFPKAKIVIVFRRHGDIVLSLYKQYIQEGGILKFDEFYNENGVIKNSDLIFQNWIVFLKENFADVDILSYERFKKVGIKYFDDYFGTLGLVPYKGQSKKINPSISGKKIEILRRINKFYFITPRKIQKGLRLTKLSPRHFLQYRFSFWKSRDSQRLLERKNEINREFLNDWRFVEKIAWV